MGIKRKITLISLVLYISLTLVGCWDYRDLEDEHIPIAASWDLAAGTGGDNKGLVIGALIPNLDPEAKKKYHFELAAGMTPGQNRIFRAAQSPGEYVLGMLQVTVIGDELARDGLGVFPRPYLRNPQIKNTVQLAVVKGRADKLLSSEQTDYANTGVYLRALLTSNQSNGFYINCELQRYFNDYYTPGKNPVLPLLALSPKNDIRQLGCAVFKKDKLIDELDLAHTRTLMLLRGVKARGYIPYVIKDEGKLVDRGTVFVKNGRKVKVTRQEDQIICDVYITLQGILTDHTSPKSLINNEDMIKRIEACTAADVKRDCEALVTKMQQEYKVDCIDIIRFVLAKWRKEFIPRADKDLIESIKINVHVKVQLKNYGESS